MSIFAGVHVATTTPFDPTTHEVDLEQFRAQASWLVDEGIAGLFPTGSLGEYESMDTDERDLVVRAAVEAAGGRALVVPGVSGPSARVVVQQAEAAKAAGADGLMVLPPTNHPATPEELDAHFRAVAEVGLPVVVYNNPFSTRQDLTPDLLARLSCIDGVRAVKEFSGDVRRVSAILELAPSLEVICGADDVALESALMGATGWIGGFTGVFPRACDAIFTAGIAGRVAEVRVAYQAMLPALRWDTTPSFVQAIKLSMDELDLPGGGVVRPPRRALADDAATKVRADTRAAQAAAQQVTA